MMALKTGRKGALRNDVVTTVCNFLLRHVATREYSDKVDLLIKQGLHHANNGNGPLIKVNK